jgi:hypothetical protein
MKNNAAEAYGRASDNPPRINWIYNHFVLCDSLIIIELHSE